MKKSALALFAMASLAGPAAMAETPDAKPAVAQPEPAKPVASPKVIMLRLYVGNLDRSEKFYQTVFGLRTVQKMGDKVRIMIFPNGAMPGIIMIESPEVATMHGSFVVQVPDLDATLKTAEANGGKHVGQDFEQGMQGMPARSIHVADPDGNLLEVLQIGGTAGR